MNMKRSCIKHSGRFGADFAAGQRGVTLIELMIALLIGLFLAGGLVTLVGGMKRTGGVQTGMSQLQDNERLAIGLIADVIQSAGYYPNPAVNTAATALPVSGVFAQTGQSIFGTGAYTAVAPGDTITVRYLTAGTVASDKTLDCSGNTSAVATTFVNQFSIDANGNLQCTLTVGAAAAKVITLVAGVQNLQILYGVQTNTASGNASADAYLDATQVGAGNYWGNVISVRVTLTFLNPLAGQPGQANTVTLNRVVDVMNKAGVST